MIEESDAALADLSHRSARQDRSKRCPRPFFFSINVDCDDAAEQAQDEDGQELGRRDEARSYFQKAVAADPLAWP